ncbi:MAG: ribosome maturation factor RimP [Rhodothermales bacterium]
MGKKATTVIPDVLERVRGLVEEVLAGTPHFLVDLDVRGASGSQVVNVFVDSDDDLGVGTLAEISRDVGFLLQTEDVIAGRYRLDVSSPGVDRPLKLPRQYKKNVGRKLRVHHRQAGDEEETELQGLLSGADDEAIELKVTATERHRILYDNIVWARVQLPW